MGIFQQFPYSNFHEYNLDQIIKIMREMQDEWTTTKSEWTSYKEFIDNYFANLNLDEETEAALRRMVADGTLDPVIDPVIIAEVTAWLADHIKQPTTPVIDSSLTIAGAAADAKVTGDAITALNNDVNNIESAIEITMTDFVKWSVGSIDPATGEDLVANNRLRTDFIDITGIEKMSITFDSSYLYITDWYDSDKNIMPTLNNGGVWQSVDRTYTNFSNAEGTAKYARVLLRRSDNTNISVSEAGHVTVKCLIENTVTDMIKSMRMFREGYIYTTGVIDVDTVNKTITFPTSYTRLITAYGENIDLTSLGTVSIPANLFRIIYYNLDTNEINFSEYYDSKATNLIVIGFCSGKLNINLNAYPNYRINGVYNTAEAPLWVKFSKYRYAPEYIAVLGDSISTYDGYTENSADDGTLDPYYPAGDVNSVDKTWWAIVGKGLRCTLSDITVSAVSRSAFMDQNDSTMPPAYDDTRINRLGANHYPSYIFVNVGTNDPYFGNLGNMTYETNIATLASLPNSTTRGIALTIRKLQNKYSNSRIVILIPKPVRFSSLSSPYTSEAVDKIAERIKELANLYGVYKVIDLRKCDINQTNVSSYCEDGAIHPNANGMTRIAEYVLNELLV